jgi:hypothetical protein
MAKLSNPPHSICLMEGVRDHCEGYTPELYKDETSQRLVIRAFNEAYYNVTEVDLLDLIEWLKKNRPDLLAERSND